MPTSSSVVSHVNRVFSLVRGGAQMPAARGFDPCVFKSWSRCVRDYGIEPQKVRDSEVLDAQAIKQRQQRFGELMRIARAEMENLYEQIAGSGYAVILTDAAGTILSSITDPALKREFRQAGLWPGAIWDERHEGTNGIGTCIVERRPITVHRDEHFMGYNIALSCSGAPITDPHGEVLAVLDASTVNCTDTRAVQRHTMALVNMSANLIAKCHFLAEFPNAWVLRFHSRPEFVGLLHEALMAIDDQGRVLAANDSAVDQLGVGSRAELLGRALDTVFQLDFATLERRANAEAGCIWPLRDAMLGRRFFATARATSAAPPRSRGSAQACAGPVTDQAASPVGSDPRVIAELARARRLFERGVPILLHGATGCGKEVFAKTLHRASPWADKPFVAVNCAAIPESLIESELFGYTRGAFTDAVREGRRGRIQQADGGTLFLDEIGDMPLALQTRLLRVIEEGEVLPLGGERPSRVELHVISASHRDLRQLLADGRFRDDLFYRLNGMTIELPPLRERSDRRELIEVLLREHSPQTRIELDPAALARLLDYDWPGNIRQLRNVLRTASALCQDGVIRLRDLPTEVVHAEAKSGDGGSLAADNPLADAERAALVAELERWRWNVTRAAQALGLSRNTLYRKMKKHHIATASGSDT